MPFFENPPLPYNNTTNSEISSRNQLYPFPLRSTNGEGEVGLSCRDFLITYNSLAMRSISLTDYDLLSFDLDGVIIDSEDFSPEGWISRAFSSALEELELEVSRANLKRLWIRNLSGGLESAAADLEVEPATLWEVRERHLLKEKVAAVRSGEIPLFADVSVLRKIARGHKLTLVSNSPQQVVDAVLDHFELDGIFECGLGRSSEVSALERMKPNPYLLERMLERTKVQNSLYVGDRDSDRKAARAAGMDFLLLDRNSDGPLDRSSAGPIDGEERIGKVEGLEELAELY